MLPGSRDGKARRYNRLIQPSATFSPSRVGRTTPEPAILPHVFKKEL